MGGLIWVLVVIIAASIVLPAFVGGAWSPTRTRVVRKMLTLAAVQPGDLVIDLGAGDGRFIIHAAKAFGARAVGVEIDPLRWALCRVRIFVFNATRKLRVLKRSAIGRSTIANSTISESAIDRSASSESALDEPDFAKSKSSSSQVHPEGEAKVVFGNFFEMDLSQARVVTFYLSQAAADRLKEKFEHELQPSARVVSYRRPIPGWHPTQHDREDDVYLYVVAHSAPLQDPSQRPQTTLTKEGLQN